MYLPFLELHGWGKDSPFGRRRFIRRFLSIIHIRQISSHDIRQPAGSLPYRLQNPSEKFVPSVALFRRERDHRAVFRQLQIFTDSGEI